MSNQKRSKLPFGCLIIAGIIATICGTAVSIRALSSAFAPAPAPTLDTNAIVTAVFQTALAMNLETQAASIPTPEPTLTSLPTATDTRVPLPTATDAVIPVTGASCIPDNPPQTGKVVDIVDGDTIKVLLDQDGKTYSVRYIGMDTPENTSQVEYFGSEAAAKNAELVYGKNVTLIKDVSETDHYNRLLRYVIADDVFVNYELVAQGYANTASYPPDVACIPTFQAAERQALASELGFWGASPTSTPYIQPTIAVVPQQPSSNSGSCCKVCGPKSKPCGDSCISLSYTCHKPPGCACDD
jgi:micrococcal nuclease